MAKEPTIKPPGLVKPDPPPKPPSRVVRIPDTTFSADHVCPHCEVTGKCTKCAEEKIAGLEERLSKYEDYYCCSGHECGCQGVSIAEHEFGMNLMHSDTEAKELRSIMSKVNEEISQTLGKALGYPWFKDDQKNFPEATEENGVCVGDHVAETLAREAAKRIAYLMSTQAHMGWSEQRTRSNEYEAASIKKDELLKRCLEYFRNRVSSEKRLRVMMKEIRETVDGATGVQYCGLHSWDESGDCPYCEIDRLRKKVEWAEGAYDILDHIRQSLNTQPKHANLQISPKILDQLGPFLKMYQGEIHE